LLFEATWWEGIEKMEPGSEVHSDRTRGHKTQAGNWEIPDSS